MVRPSLKLLMLCIAPLMLPIERASADLGQVLPELGDLQRWSVFSLGWATTGDEFAGNTVIEGDVGVAGNGDIALHDNATIQGNVYYRSNGTLTIAPGAQITGAQIHDQDALLDNDVAAALATSHHAASLSQNYFAPTDLELTGNRNFTVTGAPGDNVVLKLGNFTLSGNSTFTLQGTATTTFIINVTKQFALSANAKIVLSGDVQWSNVLFNVCGKDSAVSLSGNSSLSGMLMANRRTVQVSGRASVTGELIANRVMFTRTGFHSSGTVTHPPIVSP
jgi:cytoskeletal protein CcmA (bactofilin family)